MFPQKHQSTAQTQIILNPFWINEEQSLATDFNREVVVAGIQDITGSTGILIRTAKRWGELIPPTTLYDSYYKPFDYNTLTYLGSNISGLVGFLGRTFTDDPGYSYTLSRVRLKGKVYIKRPGSGGADYQEVRLTTNVYRANLTDYTDHCEIPDLSDGASLYNATQIGTYENKLLDRSNYAGFEVKTFTFDEYITLDNVSLISHPIPDYLILGFAFPTSSYIELQDKPYIYEVDFEIKKHLQSDILTLNNIPVTVDGEVITVTNVVTHEGESVTVNGEAIYI